MKYWLPQKIIFRETQQYNVDLRFCHFHCAKFKKNYFNGFTVARIPVFGSKMAYLTQEIFFLEILLI